MTAPRRSCRILLINPNSTVATTHMMVAIARGVARDGWQVTGATATRAPPMIVDPGALRASATEVVEIGLANQGGYDGMIVAAFGDPGLTELRARIALPVAGIAEAAMLEAAFGGRRFGVATTTPGLATQIDARADDLGLAGQYTGIRITEGDPNELVRNPGMLRMALAEAARACINRDRAEAVIIGGGPLGQAALELQPMFPLPIIVPVQAATRHLAALLGLGKPIVLA